MRATGEETVVHDRMDDQIGIDAMRVAVGRQSVAHAAPKLNWDDMAQSPALPLGSWLKTDPWDDRVHRLNAKTYAPMNPRDKMPLEVTPVYFKLQRYSAAMPPASNTTQEQPGNGNDQNAPSTSPSQTTAPPSAQQQVPAESSAQQQQPPAPAPQNR